MLADTEAAVLAGGASRRMGTDKAWLTLGGRFIIDHVLGALRPLVGRLRIISNESRRFETLDVPVQPDLYADAGPLGGIHAALATSRSPVIIVAGCDFPFLSTRFMSGLVSLLRRRDAVVPRREGRPVPVCAVYSIRCLPVIEKRILGGLLRTTDFLGDVTTHWVEGEELEQLDPEGLALTNLNTPEDYEKARTLVQSRPSLLLRARRD